MRIVLDQVGMTYPTPDGVGNEVLRDISLTAQSGEIIVLFGANGCGKTTLVNLVSGIDTPTTGTMTIDGVQPNRKHIGYVFQNYSASLLPWLSLESNITLPLRLRGVPEKARQQSLQELLVTTNLTGLPLEKFPFQTSGGQQQKACILRAILAANDFLIFDEPFSALDRSSKSAVESLLQRLRNEFGALSIVIVHDLDDAIFLSDRIICIDGPPGQIIAQVPVPIPWPRTPSIRLDPDFLAIRKAILGQTQGIA